MLPHELIRLIDSGQIPVGTATAVLKLAVYLHSIDEDPEHVLQKHITRLVEERERKEIIVEFHIIRAGAKGRKYITIDKFGKLDVGDRVRVQKT